jgi:hypothetical protein
MANEWWKNVAFLGNNPFMGGINTLANKSGNNRNLNYDQGLSEWGSPMGNVPDAPSMPPMLDQTGQMGAYTNTPRTPEGIPFHPDQGNTGRWDQQNVPDERTNWITKGGNFLKKFSPTGIINALTRRQGATESFGGYPGSGYGSRAGLFPQEVSNLRQAASVGALGNQGQDVFGTNIVSRFGNYNQAMADDLANFKAKLQDESYLSRFANPNQIKTLEDLEEAMKTKYGDRTRIADKLNYLRHWDNQGTAADKITSDPTEIDISQTEIIDRPVNIGGTTTGGGGRHDYQRDRGGGYTLGGGFADQRSGARGTTTSRGDVRGHHSRAYGGRIGYQDGELVEDEYMAEATPGGMMEENIEEVQGEPSREQLEAIALEIFRLPLEELNEEQLNVVYQAAMEQEPAEEEVQFAAQEGPGQGIASLV